MPTRDIHPTDEQAKYPLLIGDGWWGTVRLSINKTPEVVLNGKLEKNG